jgi:hypothetical protein
MLWNTELAGSQPRQETLTVHAVTPEQQRGFESKLAQFLYTTLTPLVRLSSPEPKAALAVLGATPPDRKRAAGELLDVAYDRAVMKVVRLVSHFKLVCITMDGWKSRRCEHRSPLITIALLLPNGTSHFWKV